MEHKTKIPSSPAKTPPPLPSLDWNEGVCVCLGGGGGSVVADFHSVFQHTPAELIILTPA